MSKVSFSVFVVSSIAVVIAAAPPQARRGMRYLKASVCLINCRVNANWDQLSTVVPSLLGLECKKNRHNSEMTADVAVSSADLSNSAVQHHYTTVKPSYRVYSTSRIPTVLCAYCSRTRGSKKTTKKNLSKVIDSKTPQSKSRLRCESEDNMNQQRRSAVTRIKWDGQRETSWQTRQCFTLRESAAQQIFLLSLLFRTHIFKMCPNQTKRTLKPFFSWFIFLWLI